MGRTLWDRRYLSEGHIWGDAPSPTAKWLATRIRPASCLLDVGFGYGRDMLFFAEQGHRVHGVELSPEAMRECDEQLHSRGFRDRIMLTLGCYTNMEHMVDDFDAIYSHRTLHLLDDSQVERFVAHTASILRSSGMVCVSARDERDFNANQMRMISSGIAEYMSENRLGHRIRFWSEARFREYFGPYFGDFEFREETEVEAKGNSVSNAHFTIMLARLRSPSDARALLG